jgi:hypothetical protein
MTTAVALIILRLSKKKKNNNNGKIIKKLNTILLPIKVMEVLAEGQDDHGNKWHLRI